MFSNCITLDELKKEYFRLCLLNHPDRGGDTATMQAINAEREKAIARIMRGAGFSDSDIHDRIEEEAEYAERIDAVISLDNVTVEIVGRWIWLTGDTRTHKDAIKTAGYFWAPKKLAWYWRPAEHKSRNRKKLTLDEIRNLHGSRKVERVTRPAIG